MSKMWRAVAVGAALGLLGIVSAGAESMPSGNINFIVPYPPGGGTDIPARLITDAIAKQTGWRFVVQNQPGAGGNIGLAQLARTAPSGLNIGMGQTSNLAVNPSLYKDIPYDPLKDFTHIALVTTQPMAIVTNPNSPFSSLEDMIKAVKEKPGDVVYGTPGSGTVAHLTMELLSTKADTKIVHVPYPGIAQAISDVMSGVVDVYIGSVPSVLPHVRSGGVKALAVTSPERSSVLPDVPTVAEVGYENFEAADWKAIVGPANMSPEIINELNTAINVALQDEGLRAKIEEEGSTIMGGSSDEFKNYLADELNIWSEVIKSSGATVN